MQYFISDPHIGHANTLKYSRRLKFMNQYELAIMRSGNYEDISKLIISRESATKHDLALITNWNSRVKVNDTVIVIGDFCFRNSPGGKPGEGTTTTSDEWLNRLNGRIVLVKGNHDKSNGTKTIIENLTIGIGGRRIFCVHKPEHCNTDYSINFTGHVHGAWKFKRVTKNGKASDLINVGVDQWNYRPVTYNEIMKEYMLWVKRGRPNVKDK